MDAATASQPQPEREPVSVRVGTLEIRRVATHLSDNEFEVLCASNPELRIEQDPAGNILVMAPVSYDSGNQESEIIADLTVWNRRTALGKTFSSSTLFILPDGSKRMPDAAWITLEKHQQLTPEKRRKFAAITPDFIVEVRSPSDDLDVLREKMSAVWIANGVRLAWLLDPVEKKVWIYRANGSVEVLEGFSYIMTGEEVLPGFEFDLTHLDSR